MTDEIEQEIAELEREAQDPINSPETRYFNEVKAHLLRHGYRLQHTKADSRIIAIVHLATEQNVYLTTENELRFARIDKQAWLNIARLEYYKKAEGF